MRRADLYRFRSTADMELVAYDVKAWRKYLKLRINQAAYWLDMPQTAYREFERDHEFLPYFASVRAMRILHNAQTGRELLDGVSLQPIEPEEKPKRPFF